MENDGENPCEDIDVFKFKIKNKPKNVYIELIVPVIGDYYKDFVPWFALVGPNLSIPDHELPFNLPDGYGAIVNENVEPGYDREEFFEPFRPSIQDRAEIYRPVRASTSSVFP